ncbi:helix-turn-helix domain-containing protein [Caulobacter segnis]|uniref:TrmB family transcriptional regulator n=1 Tax=Caulobacter segnis TaxID=88688 RepID=UPI00240F8DC1|nr:helix-turn-helix domain-containing protein [Caulobacter segnis]MDG2521761.1 helix-turn-helix domain-containing protein [Caulobacter segnis]
MTTTNPEGALLELGFTDTEAKLFCELTRIGPATGYRLSKAVSKAAANTYQALESLSQKGAVLVDDTDGKTWRAVPADELIAALQSGFQQRSETALAALKTLQAPQAEARLYALKTPQQVLARARAMIASAQSVLLFDLFPEPFAALEDDLLRAVARGVSVAGQIYAPAHTELDVVLAPGSPAQIDAWPGLQVTIIPDAREHMVALLSRDAERCLHGVWSDSPYLACVQHSGLAAELVLGAQTSGRPLKFKPALFASRPPGLDELLGPPSGD